MYKYHEEKIKVMGLYVKNLFPFEVDFTGVDFSNKQYKNAVKIFAPNVEKNSIVGFLDTTILNSGKNGYIFTDEWLYWMDFMGEPNRIKYVDIEEMEVINGTSSISGDEDCDKELKIVMKNGKEFLITTTIINKTPLKELLEKFKKFESANLLKDYHRYEEADNIVGFSDFVRDMCRMFSICNNTENPDDVEIINNFMRGFGGSQWISTDDIIKYYVSPNKYVDSNFIFTESFFVIWNSIEAYIFKYNEIVGIAANSDRQLCLECESGKYCKYGEEWQNLSENEVHNLSFDITDCTDGNEYAILCIVDAIFTFIGYRKYYNSNISLSELLNSSIEKFEQCNCISIHVEKNQKIIDSIGYGLNLKEYINCCILIDTKSEDGKDSIEAMFRGIRIAFTDNYIIVLRNETIDKLYNICYVNVVSHECIVGVMVNKDIETKTRKLLFSSLGYFGCYCEGSYKDSLEDIVKNMDSSDIFDYSGKLNNLVEKCIDEDAEEAILNEMYWDLFMDENRQLRDFFMDIITYVKYHLYKDDGYKKPENTENDVMKSEGKGNSILNDTTEGGFEYLKKLKEMLDLGIVTQEEFDLKKKEILNLQ